MAKAVDRKTLPDLQNTTDQRGKSIERVGVEHVKIPLKIRRKDPTDGITENIQATISMYVSIDKEFKGVNMSRFMETLMMYQSDTLTSNHLQGIMQQMLQRLESTDGYMKIAFQYPIVKFAPVSKRRSVQYYNVAFIGRLLQNKKSPLQSQKGKYNYDFVMEVTVIGTNLCPCSKEISDYGAHNQRNHVRVRFTPNDKLWWVEDVVTGIESALSCSIFPLLKREDEKWVTEKAYENPKFVEDVVRDVALMFDKFEIKKYEVRSQADESIHQHSAVAVLKHNWTDVPK